MPSRFSSVMLRMGLTLATARLVDRKIPRNREQPGRKLLGVSIGRGKPEGAEEDLLADGLHVLKVSQHAVKVRKDRRTVSLVQKRKGLFVAQLGPAHQVFV